MATQVFEADGRQFGVREVPNFRDYGGHFGKMPERSYVYFCNRCGSVWGGLYVVDAEWTSIIQRPCKRHGDGRLSLEFPSNEPLAIARDWPKEALLREFLIELRRLQTSH